LGVPPRGTKGDQGPLATYSKLYSNKIYAEAL
jgi:hypothetical protein